MRSENITVYMGVSGKLEPGECGREAPNGSLRTSGGRKGCYSVILFVNRAEIYFEFCCLKLTLTDRFLK